MHSWTALSREDHAKSHWRPRSGFTFAAQQQIVPVILAELAKMLPHYPLGFVKNESDTYQAVALVGLGGERNLYVDDGSKWLCSYVPAILRSYPFALQKDSAENAVLCIDRDFICDDAAFPRLFEDNGELEVKTSEVLQFVSQCEQNRQLTNTASDALATAGVIEPWPISVERGENEPPLKINGMHRVNEEALNKLDAEALGGLRTSGALALAYAQMYSTAQIEQLTKRAEYLAQVDQQSSPPEGLSDLFSNEDSGSLNFDAFNTASNDMEEK